MADLVDSESESRVFESPREVSGDEEGFVCSECGESFKRIQGLRRHETAKHGAAPAAPSMRSPRSSGGQRESLKGQAEAFTFLFYGLGGQLLGSVDPVCGQALMSCQKSAADAWYEVAKTNKTVRKMLSGTSSAGAWGGLFMAHLPLLMAVQQHHLTGVLSEPAYVEDAA